MESAVDEARRWAAETGGASTHSTSLSEAAKAAAGRLADAATSIIGSLVGDSWTDAAVGVRGSGTTAPRLLIFQAGNFTISISLHPHEDVESLTCDLEGQVAPEDAHDLPDGGRVELASAGRVATTKLDDLGAFSFDSVQIADARLRLILGGATYQIGPLPTVSGSEE